MVVSFTLLAFQLPYSFPFLSVLSLFYIFLPFSVSTFFQLEPQSTSCPFPRVWGLLLLHVPFSSTLSFSLFLIFQCPSLFFLHIFCFNFYMAAFSSSSTLSFNPPLDPSFCLIPSPLHHHLLSSSETLAPPPFCTPPLSSTLTLHRTEAQQRLAWTERVAYLRRCLPHPIYPTTLPRHPQTPPPLPSCTLTPSAFPHPHPLSPFHSCPHTQIATPPLVTSSLQPLSTTTDAPNPYPPHLFTPTPQLPTPSPHYDPQHKSSRDELHHKTLPFWK